VGSLPFPAHTVVRQEVDARFFQGLLDRDAREIMGRAQAALEIPDRFYGHADLIGQFPSCLNPAPIQPL
jgi:hypothetical protein